MSTFESGVYNQQNVLAYLRTRSEVRAPNALASHIMRTTPTDPNSLIGREHTLVFGALSGAYRLPGTPYPYVIAGIVTLDREDPAIFRRDQVKFPKPPAGAIALGPGSKSNAPPLLGMPSTLQHIVEGTPYYPLAPYDHVFRVEDVARLADPATYKAANDPNPYKINELQHVLLMPARQKLGIMTDFIFSEVFP